MGKKNNEVLDRLNKHLRNRCVREVYKDLVMCDGNCKECQSDHPRIEKARIKVEIEISEDDFTHVCLGLREGGLCIKQFGLQHLEECSCDCVRCWEEALKRGEKIREEVIKEAIKDERYRIFWSIMNDAYHEDNAKGWNMVSLQDVLDIIEPDERGEE